MKQTAVEWLFKNIWTNPPENLLEFLDKAKEMEKQQIMKAYYDGRNDESSSKARHNYNRNSEEYYNETFNK